ncbi:50S ribosomal protein L6 [candidate division MSBL1 archaeon SCGC-AAA259O05]|uniref:Large ribosomal subunit protein uL6 n=1 Tax=candidate division MSBL1 archaeon SCGC-AAA259O05 TaxID=1698271 RepID=A0A133V3N5_9EURY|nr:50S ribosomal protein L6 [candidate division MSBL1 archaeon SCGC-AAA259O05]
MLKQGIKKTVDFPEEVEFSLDGDTLRVSGPDGELSRVFDQNGIELDKDGNSVVLKAKTGRRKVRAAFGTAVSHIENMIKGVTEGFSCKLKVFYSHFPISVSVSDDRVKIENFLGEEKPRFSRIVGDTEVEVKGEEIEVRGIKKEDVGQTAANIEQVAQTRNRDPRVFQDGIYIVEEP